MDTFLDRAQQILETARAGEANGFEEFALVIRPDGGMHFIMDSQVSVEGAAAWAGAQSAYRVTRSPGGVRVEGRTFGQSCVLENRSVRASIFAEQRLYLTGSPVSICA